MFGSRNPSLYQLVCVVAMATAIALTGAETYDEDTGAALEEMSKLLRRLFPLIPDKAHYFWKTSHLGGSVVLGNKELQELSQDDSNGDLSSAASSSVMDSKQPWRLDSPSSMLKRGSECMRRCIEQGVLHPVQCHSLC